MNTHEKQSHQDSSKSILGFWIYLMTDCLLFASFFASYAVLRNNTNGAQSGLEIINLPYVFAETIILLFSSLTSGVAIVSALNNKTKVFNKFFIITILLGITFVGLEIYEFNNLINEGSSWTASAFLTSYFALIGLHGMHIIIGIIWAAILGMYIFAKGLTQLSIKRLQLWSMFWHFLDIIWIFIFTFVYLIGASS